MSGEAPLVEPIKGYMITVTQYGPTGDEFIALETPLQLNKVGGAHVKNPDDLIMMIEDAVFTLENE